MVTGSGLRAQKLVSWIDELGPRLRSSDLTCHILSSCAFWRMWSIFIYLCGLRPHNHQEARQSLFQEEK